MKTACHCLLIVLLPTQLNKFIEITCTLVPLLLVCLTLAPTSVFSQDAAVQLRVVALTGDDAPGVAGAKFAKPSGGRDTFTSTRVNSAGKVCFDAGIAGEGIPTKLDRTKFYNAQGIWAERADGLKLVARKGDPTPGLEDMSITDFEFRWASDDQVAVMATGGEEPSKGDTESSVYFVDDSGIYNVLTGGNELAAISGKPIRIFDEFYEQSAADGKITFASPNFSSKKRGIWVASSEEVKPVVKTMEQCPDLEDGFLFRNLVSFASNANGQVVFTAYCSKKTTRFDSIWLADPFGEASPKKLVLQSNKPAPGLPGVTLKKFKTIAINSENQILVYASLEGEGMISDRIAYNKEALFQYDGEQWKLLMRRGSAAPEGSKPNTVLTLIGNPIISSSGQVAMIGTGQRDGERGGDTYILSNASGEFKPIAQNGDLASGLGEEVTFTMFSENAFAGPEQLVFRALHSDRTAGLWASKAGAEPVLLVKTETEIEVRPGEKRTIKRLMKRTSTSPSTDGKAGYVSFVVVFEDGSQAICVATL